MGYNNPVELLGRLLDDLGTYETSDTIEAEWAYDVVREGEWFTANHTTDQRMIECYIEHVSDDAIGYSSLTLKRGLPV